MDIEKYYWETVNENEARVVVALLGKFFNNFNLCIGDRGRTFYGIKGGNVGVVSHRTPTTRTKSTIDQLVEWACNGFKEPWKVAEDGFKVVSVEDRKEFDYPTDCDVRWFGNTGHWVNSTDPACWKRFEEDMNSRNFAVPTDYVFETQRDKKIRELADEIRHKTTELEKLKAAE